METETVEKTWQDNVIERAKRARVRLAAERGEDPRDVDGAELFDEREMEDLVALANTPRSDRVRRLGTVGVTPHLERERRIIENAADAGSHIPDIDGLVELEFSPHAIVSLMERHQAAYARKASRISRDDVDAIVMEIQAIHEERENKAFERDIRDARKRLGLEDADDAELVPAVRKRMANRKAQQHKIGVRI